MTHGDHDGVHGDVHHDDVQDLQAGAEGRDGDDVEAAGADSQGLEEAVEHAVVRWDRAHGGVVEVEGLEGEPVDAVEDYEYEEEPPGLHGGRGWCRRGAGIGGRSGGWLYGRSGARGSGRGSRGA